MLVPSIKFAGLIEIEMWTIVKFFKLAQYAVTFDLDFNLMDIIRYLDQ